MWWPPIIVGLLMLSTGLVFVVRRKMLAHAYAQRVKPLPPEHPQYRQTPFATPGLFAAVGVMAVIGGSGAVLMGIFTP